MDLVGGEKSQSAAKNLIKNSNTASFGSDVIKASAEIPIIVDFWAPWSAPCKKISPLLEKLTQQANGLARLVKVDVDENPELAAQLRVRTIPTVYVFKNGQPADGFVGEQSESQIIAFFKRLTGDAKAPLDLALDKANEALGAGDWQLANNIFSQVLGEDPANAAAIAGVMRSAIAAGNLTEARTIAESLEQKIAAKSEIKSALSALELAEQGSVSGDITGLRQTLGRDENNLQVRFDLAMALQGDSQSEEAVNELLDLVSRDIKWNDEMARKNLLKIFDALGASHPLSISGRKRLASILFA